MKRVIASLFLVLLTTAAHADPDAEIQVVSVQALPLQSLGSHLRYSIKADVENTGEPGKVFVDIVGLNANGFQIASTVLEGRFGSGETKSLTGTLSCSSNNGEVATWRAAGQHKYPAKKR